MSQDLELKIRLKADGSGLVGEFRQSTGEVKKFGDQLDKTSTKSTQGINQLTKGASAANSASNNLGGSVARSSKSLRKFHQEGGTANSVSRALGGSVSVLSSNFAALAGVSALSIVGLGSAIISVNSQYQKLTAQLTVLTGSQLAANAEFDRWSDFASKTPSQISEVVGSFVKLRNFGLRATEREMRSYSNTAAATGKTLNQLIEAVADASTLEFERLKEFGILSRQEGDSIKFTFRGVTTEVKKDSGEIQDYLRRIGETEFAGSIEEQMKTIGGSTSNLTDNLLSLLDTIGRVSGADKAASELFNRLARGAAALSDSIEETDVEKQQRIFDQMLEINFKLSRIGEGGDKRSRSVLTSKLNALKAELNEVNARVNAQIEAESEAYLRQKKQDKATEEAKVAEKSAIRKEALENEMQALERHAADKEVLSYESLRRDLATLEQAEREGVESIQSYSQLRENLLTAHYDRIEQITLQKTQAIERKKNQERLKASRAERERRRAISDARAIELGITQGYLDRDFDITNAHQARKEIAEKQHQDRLRSERLNRVGDYGALTQQFVDFDRASGGERVAIGLSVATQLSGAAARESKKAFNLHKALSMAQAGVSAALSIVSVLGDATIPSTTAKIALATTIGTLAAFQVAAIQKQEFQGGRMLGGRVSANAFVEVGEQNRPELFKQDGKLLLFPGNRGGEVVPLEGNRSIPKSSSTSDSVARPVVVNLYNAPPGAEVTQTGDQIDVMWPQVQNRLSRDLSQGAAWAKTGEATYGWNRAAGARVKR